MILPLPVTRKRFLAPECVLFFGMIAVVSFSSRRAHSRGSFVRGAERGPSFVVRVRLERPRGGPRRQCGRPTKASPSAWQGPAPDVAPASRPDVLPRAWRPRSASPPARACSTRRAAQQRGGQQQGGQQQGGPPTDVVPPWASPARSRPEWQ